MDMNTERFYRNVIMRVILKDNSTKCKCSALTTQIAHGCDLDVTRVSFRCDTGVIWMQHGSDLDVTCTGVNHFGLAKG